MSILNNSLLLGAAAIGGSSTGYQISRSLRFNSSDSAFLSRTPASAGNRKTWTWAAWVKRSALTDGHFFTVTSGTTDSTYLRLWITNNRFYLGAYSVSYRGSTAYLRDPSAWYHLVCAVDTTQAVGANRIRLYINGVEVSSYVEYADPAQNADLAVNQATAHYIGTETVGSGFFNGYLADIHFIDGQALTPSSFTETSATTGQLIPKAYSGSFGTNGFWLKFSDNSAATATTLGKDYSGNNNNWTPNNLSVTAGAGNDSLVDTPTSGSQVDTGLGGQVTGNYATFSPLWPNAPTISNGNLDVTGPDNTAMATIGMPSGKWYFETTVVTVGGITAIGVSGTQPGSTNYPGFLSDGYCYISTGNKQNNGSSTAYAASYTSGDVIGCAFDADAGTLSFYKNGTSQGTAYTSIPAKTYYFSVYGRSAGGSNDLKANFGQRPFAYPVSGFKALCGTNLPAPVVAKPSTVMDVKLYTGNGSTTGDTQTISGLGFSPDLVWIKARSAARWNILCDTIRGTNKTLYSNSTYQEESLSNVFNAFNSDGFQVAYNSAYTDVFSNLNGQTYVAWAWDAGSSTVTNTQGSITSQVRANASAGFSIVTYTGNGSSGATVGHGLGVTPQLIIIKSRSLSVEGWNTYHASLTAGYALQLNSTQAQFVGSPTMYPTAPGSSVFTLGTNSGTNSNGATYVAYCFAPVAGYASAFSFTGNGSTDGPAVWLGFRPKLLIVKRTDTTGNWTMKDSSRSTYNVNNLNLFSNLSNAETTEYEVDFLSNGFKVRNTWSDWNANGGTYVGFAWAESPFAYSRAR